MKVSIILAAGEGSRMKSKTPKVLHHLAGKTILSYVIDNCVANNIDKNVLIVGHESERIKEEFAGRDLVFKQQPVGQGQPYGTGYAVKCAIDEFEDEDIVFVLAGDTPLFQKETIGRFMDFAQSHDYAAYVLTSIVEDPFGYGRIIRGQDSAIQAIIEEKDATDKEKAIREVNSGVFAFRGGALKEGLDKLEANNSQAELYLTDVVKHLVGAGEKVAGFIMEDEEEMLGVNSRFQLALCEKIMRRRINRGHMERGVSFLDPDTSLIDADVKIGKDTLLYPGVILEGMTDIGEDVTLIGSTRISNSTIGSGTIIDNSIIEDSQVGPRVTIGPYAHLRPKSVIKEDVHLGNFVEVKNSTIGQASKAGHLAYIGDGDIGKNVNIGCGVIFANYNGKEKFRSKVGDHVFLGSNSNLVAPVEIGEGAYIAAGSTITRNVGRGELAVERGKQTNIPGWADRKEK